MATDAQFLPAITNSWASNSNSIQPKSFSIRAWLKYISATMRPEWRTSPKPEPTRLLPNTGSSMKPSRIAVKDTQFLASCVQFFRTSPNRPTQLFFDGIQPVGVLYRPSENKLRNAKQKDYLGKAVSDLPSISSRAPHLFSPTSSLIMAPYGRVEIGCDCGRKRGLHHVHGCDPS